MRTLVLSRRQIQDAVDAGKITIEEFEPLCLKTCSYSLRLSGKTNVITVPPGEQPVDVLDLERTRQLVELRRGEQFVLHPGQFILATSLESLSLDEAIAAFVTPLSHISRLGVGFLGSTFIRPGFSAGQPTPIVFEFCNHGCLSLLMRRGMPFCHAVFVEVAREDRELGDTEGRRDVRSNLLFSRYDLKPAYRDIVRKLHSDRQRDEDNGT